MCHISTHKVWSEVPYIVSMTGTCVIVITTINIVVFYVKQVGLEWPIFA